MVVTATKARTGIQGMGGIGKSVLASMLAWDHEVRRSFPDEVIWVPIGQKPPGKEPDGYIGPIQL